jgi:phenylacetate-coenzyme A ligase PaaK-like adenylate-forming protein
MLDHADLWNIQPFSLYKPEKETILTRKLGELTKYHYDNCGSYRGILNGLGFQVDKVTSPKDIPFLPVSLFKSLDLISINQQDVFKTMTSSGTSGQAVSKIYLDKTTASNQQKTLVKIVSDFTGTSRMPLLVIDSPSVLSDRSQFSARGAGILGFTIFGQDRTYALNDDMSINLEAIEAFLEKHSGKNILLFGFTFMIWQHFYKELLRLNSRIDLSKGIMIHGGGWKKLLNEAVSPTEFKSHLNSVCGLQHVHDYYGMVEQTGCIYMECDQGHLHASIYSDVIVRRSHDFSPCKFGEPGVIQVVSVLPESYPGHSLLTEDEGVILGEDDCPCGRKGKYFKIIGRLMNAELRGCSDTYAAKF